MAPFSTASFLTIMLYFQLCVQFVQEKLSGTVNVLSPWEWTKCKRPVFLTRLQSGNIEIVVRNTGADIREFSWANTHPAMRTAIGTVVILFLPQVLVLNMFGISIMCGACVEFCGVSNVSLSFWNRVISGKCLALNSHVDSSIGQKTS